MGKRRALLPKWRVRARAVSQARQLGLVDHLALQKNSVALEVKIKVAGWQT